MSSPSASVMPDVEAVSSYATRAVPPIVGAPAAAVFGSGVSSRGPATVAEGLLVNCRRFSPLVQIAPETPHSHPAGSVIVTSPSAPPTPRSPAIPIPQAGDGAGGLDAAAARVGAIPAFAPPQASGP